MSLYISRHPFRVDIQWAYSRNILTPVEFLFNFICEKTDWADALKVTLPIMCVRQCYAMLARVPAYKNQLKQIYLNRLSLGLIKICFTSW